MKARLIDRLFNVEYTSFEQKQISGFTKARKNVLVELTGFVSWIEKGRFLLLPSKTTNTAYIICKVEEDMERPANHQYISCKGKWGVDVNHTDNSPYKILIIEHTEPAKPDFGKIESDVSPKDFHDFLYEVWVNIDSITQKLLLQSFVSCPSTHTRAGGFTIHYLAIQDNKE